MSILNFLKLIKMLNKGRTMKIALIIFFSLIAMCVLYAPFVISGRMSDGEIHMDKEKKSRK